MEIHVAQICVETFLGAESRAHDKTYTSTMWGRVPDVLLENLKCDD